MKKRVHQLLYNNLTSNPQSQSYTVKGQYSFEESHQQLTFNFHRTCVWGMHGLCFFHFSPFIHFFNMQYVYGHGHVHVYVYVYVYGHVQLYMNLQYPNAGLALALMATVSFLSREEERTCGSVVTLYIIYCLPYCLKPGYTCNNVAPVIRTTLYPMCKRRIYQYY